MKSELFKSKLLELVQQGKVLSISSLSRSLGISRPAVRGHLNRLGVSLEDVVKRGEKAFNNKTQVKEFNLEQEVLELRASIDLIYTEVMNLKKSIAALTEGLNK